EMMRSAGLAILVFCFVCGCHHQTTEPPKPQTIVRHSRSGGFAQPNASEPQLNYDELVRRGMNDLELKHAMYERTFQISQAAWNVDQDAGLIRFQSPDGNVATAQVQIIGMYNNTEGTWQWAWDNPSVNRPLAALADSMRAYGQQNNLLELTTAKLPCNEE